MQIAKKVVAGTTITFQWADETENVIDCKSFAENIMEHAMVHGFSQKLGDSYSQAAGDVRKAQMMFLETLEALTAGDWNRKGGGFSSGGIWVEAYAKAAGEDIEKALESWNNLSDEEKADVRKHPQVKLAKAEIEMERAKAKAADADAISI